MSVLNRLVFILVSALLTAGCEPEDQTPGLWVSGTAREFPSDCRFTNGHREIALEVGTPYFIPHSITIWCAELDGELYVAAARPETKNWPGWVDDDPEVRLGIGDRIYEVKLVPITDASLIARIRRGASAKYNRAPPPGDVAIRFWQVQPRS